MRLTIFLLLTSLALSACVPKVETRVTSAGTGTVSRSNFVLAPLEKTSSPELLLGRRLVVERLLALGLAESASGPLYLQVGVSGRPASLALTQTNKALAIKSPKKSSQKCPLYDHRLSIVLTQIADGSEIYRASASEFHCGTALAETLPILAEKAMADFGNPRGEYVIYRQR
jgi:hypothetical protein